MMWAVIEQHKLNGAQRRILVVTLTRWGARREIRRWDRWAHRFGGAVTDRISWTARRI